MAQGEDEGETEEESGRRLEGLSRRRTAVTDLEDTLGCPLTPPRTQLTFHVRCSSLCRRRASQLKGNKRDKSRTHSIILADGGVAAAGWRRGSSAAGYDTRSGGGRLQRGRAGRVFFVVFYSTVPGRRPRLNYSVSCIVVLLLFTVIAHHLKAHSYNQTTRHRNVLFSECTCESSLPPHPWWDAGCTVRRQ